MKQFMIKKIILLLLSLLIVLSYLIIFFSFNEYSQIDYVDHDEGFLLEQLILKLDFFDINQSISSVAEYGAEYYYIKYIFLLIANITELNLIAIFKIKVFINACFALLGFFYIYKIFDLLHLDKFFYVFFLLTLISTPEILFLTVSLKPDLNILLFSLIMTFYFFLISSIKNNKTDFFLFLFFLALSMSIKAWAFPFIILLFFNKFNYLDKFSKIDKILFFLLFSVTIIFFNIYFVELKNYILNNNEFILFYNENSNIHILTILYDIFKNYFIFVLVIFNLLILSLLFFSLTNKKKFNLSTKLYLFFSLWFLIWFPYIVDFNIFLKTIIEHSYATVLNKYSTTYENYENIILYTIYDIKNFEINLLVIIIFLISPLIIFYNKYDILNKSKYLTTLLLLSLCLFCFVNFISDYSNQYPAKYLYFIFINLYVYYFLNFYLTKFKILKSLCYILVLPLIFNLYFNFYKYYDFINMLTIEKKISKIIDYHQYNIDFRGKNLILCSSSYPINIDKTKLTVISSQMSSECFNHNFIKKLNDNDIIFFDSNVKLNKQTVYFLNNLELIYNDKNQFVGRFGIEQIKSHYFYKKIIN